MSLQFYIDNKTAHCMAVFSEMEFISSPGKCFEAIVPQQNGFNPICGLGAVSERDLKAPGVRRVYRKTVEKLHPNLLEVTNQFTGIN